VKPVRVGIQLPETERDVRWPEYAAMAREAEAVGFDSIWIGDHLLYRDDGQPERGPWEAWTILAAIAAVTERVLIGPLVACSGFHAPGVLAKMAATVDEISGGRLIFGIGAGWNAPDFDAFDLPYDHRVARFAESFSILRPLLAGERVTFAGTYWQANDAVLLPPPSRTVPFMVGSNGDRMLSITLPYVERWNTWYDDYGNNPEGFEELNERISKAAELAGRAPGDIYRSACVFVSLAGAPNARSYDKEADPVEGSMENIADHLQALGEAGADEVILVVSPITVDSIHELGEVIRLLGRH
jgi:alkanesulfonate monooxygenase SsuD/methylene tetrahydromethanopterin reductase-like flavin-dependent oxidoreductase (luciferase family)